MVSDPNGVTIGIDAAVVANHYVAIRGSTGGEVISEDFAAAPTLAGLESLTDRLAAYPGALAVAEPTGMSWLSLGHAVSDAGCGFALIETRHSSKLREAISGKNKTDVIDADMLRTRCAPSGPHREVQRSVEFDCWWRLHRHVQPVHSPFL